VSGDGSSTRTGRPGASAERKPGPVELLEAAIRTIEEVLAPELQTPWARASAIGLVGQLRYGLQRIAHDSLEEQDDALETCLEALLGEHAELRDAIAEVSSVDQRSWDLRARAAHLLVWAQGREGAPADAVRGVLRPLLIGQARQDLGESGPMLAAFLAADSLGSQG
jgi:hypothetical protein